MSRNARNLMDAQFFFAFIVVLQNTSSKLAKMRVVLAARPFFLLTLIVSLYVFGIRVAEAVLFAETHNS